MFKNTYYNLNKIKKNFGEPKRLWCIPLPHPKMNNPFIKVFANHLIFFCPTPNIINYSWSFGSLPGFFFAFQIITAIFLVLYFTRALEFFKINKALSNVKKQTYTNILISRIENMLKSKIFLTIIWFHMSVCLLAISYKDIYYIDYESNKLNQISFLEQFIVLWWPYNTLIFCIVPILISLILYNEKFPFLSKMLSVFVIIYFELKLALKLAFVVLYNLLYGLNKQIITNKLNNVLFNGDWFKIIKKLDNIELEIQIKTIWNNLLTDLANKNENVKSSFDIYCEKLYTLYEQQKTNIYELYNIETHVDKLNENINTIFENFKQKNIIIPEKAQNVVETEKSAFINFLYDNVYCPVNNSITYGYSKTCQLGNWLIYDTTGNIVLCSACVLIIGIFMYARINTANTLSTEIHEKTNSTVNNLNNINDLQSNVTENLPTIPQNTGEALNLVTQQYTTIGTQTHFFAHRAYLFDSFKDARYIKHLNSLTNEIQDVKNQNFLLRQAINKLKRKAVNLQTENADINEKLDKIFSILFDTTR